MHAKPVVVSNVLHTARGVTGAHCIMQDLVQAPTGSCAASPIRQQAAQHGVSDTFLGFLCHNIVTHDITHHPTALQQQDASGDGCNRASPDIRCLMGLLAGYLLMNDQGRQQRPTTKMCVAEIQCIVREVLTHHDSADISESAMQLWQWARRKQT